YLIKFCGHSYHDVIWVHEKWIQNVSPQKLRNFKRKIQEGFDPNENPIKKEWLIPELVFEATFRGPKGSKVIPSIKNISKILIKWEGLPFSEGNKIQLQYLLAKLFLATTKSYRSMPVKLKEQCKPLVLKYLSSYKIKKSLHCGERQRFTEMTTQPEFIDSGTLYPYQLDGLNWLLYQWCRGKPSILADEMGLGKTIQIISYLYALYKNYNVYPSLIIAPKAVLPNWRREFDFWAKDMVVATYAGEKDSLQTILSTGLFEGEFMKAHVLLTTYETFNENLNLFTKFAPWQNVILDECQRIKNSETKTFKQMQKVNTYHKILITGTPLQNNITELFNIMSYIDPDQFSDKDKFIDEFEDLNEESLKKLHELLKPYFLRRVKKDVSIELPKKIERTIPVTMTSLQRNLYKATLQKNVKLLASIASERKGRGSETTTVSLRNIYSDLRKCLMHPFLIPNIEPDTENLSDDVVLDHILSSSAKLKLVDRILYLLKKRNHRVLIFSQFKIMLDILEDYLYMSDYSYTRIDGDTPSEIRQSNIDKFNEKSSDIFVFLITTRAGGVGINLTSADTVIMYDLDFNPQADIQALNRVHRIGQKKPVLIIRLVTRGSIEERLLEIAKNKMVLEHLIIDRMGNIELKNTDLENIIRFGAKALFDESKPLAEIFYTNDQLNKLLERNVTEEEVDGEKKVESQGAFAFAKIWEND
ncbi:hypothetical protein K502DRAFT_272827, partial [Neoconidiobolus thromboides FSU 785]